MPYYAVYDAGWRLFERGLYDSYKSIFLNPPTGNKAKIVDWVNNLNNYADSILSNSFKSGVVSSSTEGALFKYDVTEDAVKKPNFYIVIKADKLGIKTQVPIPKITKINNADCFYSGGVNEWDKSEGQIDVTVKNVGESGIILLSGTCTDSNFVIRDTEKWIDAGKTKTVTLYYTASTSKKISEARCVVKAYTTGGVSKTDVKVCVKGYTVCNSGAKSCGYDLNSKRDYIKVCNKEGTGFEIVKFCEASEECLNAKCVPKGSGGGDGDDDEGGFNLSFIVLIGGLIGLVYGIIKSRNSDSWLSKTLSIVGYTLLALFMGFVVAFIIKLVVVLIRGMAKLLGGI
ncbi:MAG: hypothetical protein DRP42_03290 [Tenericutes bacterium]|nr:MAG: hypothetical protein DRP42_03290 [Mycoplasmatota bacterium]